MVVREDTLAGLSNVSVCVSVSVIDLDSYSETGHLGSHRSNENKLTVILFWDGCTRRVLVVNGGRNKQSHLFFSYSRLAFLERLN